MARARARDHEEVDPVPAASGLRSAHGRLARALESQRPAPPAREIAEQWRAAGDAARFARWALAAAEEARQAGDVLAQVDLLDGVLTQWEEPGVAPAVGMPWAAVATTYLAALRLAGRAHDAVILAQTVLLDPRVADPDHHAAVLVEFGGALTETADARAAGVAAEALEEVRRLPDSPRSTRLLALVAGSLGNVGDDREAAEPSAEAARRAERWGLDDVAARSDTTVGSLLAAVDPAAASAAFERARVAAERMADTDPMLLLRYYTNVGDALRIQGRADLAAAAATTGLTWAVDRGFTESSGAHLAATLAEALFDAGRLEEVARVVEQWLPRATASRERWWLTAIRGRLELAVGDPSAARSSMVSVLSATAPERLPHSPAVTVALLRCELAVRSRGRASAVHEVVDVAHTLQDRAPVTALELLALAASRRGSTRADRASEEQTDALESALQDRVHPRVAAPWNAIASAWTVASGTAESAASWDLALGASRSALPFVWRVRTLLAAAQDALAAGRNARARQFLSAARELVDASGARAWATDLDALEVALLPPATDGWEQLSPREAQVLRHLATGATNEDTARSLAISVRTVEVHVGHVLRKLGVASRGTAVAAAVRRGLLDEDDLRGGP